MTNQQVIDLVKNGFSDALVVELIQSSKNKRFDLTSASLIALKQAGVSERVLSAMLGVPAAAPQADATGVPPSASNSHSAGIYAETESGEVLLEPTVFSGGKTGGFLASALTGGLKKAQWKAVVRSPRAQLRLHSAFPVFHFRFENVSSGLGSSAAMFNASSPNEFVLARMQANKNERTLVVGESGAFGTSSGTRSQDTVQIKVERISPGVYRVTPEVALTEGEYCFFYAAGASTFVAAGSGKLFDFGIQRK